MSKTTVRSLPRRQERTLTPQEEFAARVGDILLGAHRILSRLLGTAESVTVTLRAEPVDVTGWGDTVRQLNSGQRSLHVAASGIAEMDDLAALQCGSVYEVSAMSLTPPLRGAFVVASLTLLAPAGAVCEYQINLESVGPVATW